MSMESEVAVKKRSFEIREASAERLRVVIWAWTCLSWDRDLDWLSKEIKEDGVSI